MFPQLCIQIKAIYTHVLLTGLLSSRCCFRMTVAQPSLMSMLDFQA